MINLRTLFTLSFCFLLASCQQFQSSSPAKIADLSLRSSDKQNLQFNQIVALLEQGKSQQATPLLKELLQANPKHGNAIVLSQQLKQSPQQFFNTKRFTHYQVKANDSLGAIAQKWLNNPLHFVALARLNNIAVPAKLKPGQKIKIPLTASGLAITQQKARSKANLKLLDDYIEKHEYLTGLKKSNQLFILATDFPQLLVKQKALLKAFSLSSVSFTEQEDMINACQALQKSARSSAQKKQIGYFILGQKQKLYTEQAELLFKDNSLVETAEKLIQLKAVEKKLKLEPKKNLIEQPLVNSLHEQAIIFYRNHALEQALSYWQLISKLQADNKLAQKYIVRTEKLLKNLKQY
jgi:hypothetical protein